MKVKNKLWLGFGFLFVVVLLFGALCLFYLNKVADSSKLILKDNYISLSYCREMRSVLDNNKPPLTKTPIAQFSTYLQKEEANITEPGEAEVVARLGSLFKELQNSGTNQLVLEKELLQIRRCISAVELINMRAITRKNDSVGQYVDHSVFILGFAATLTLLVIFSFSINFPSFILKPINTLLSGIKAISEKDYKTRIRFAKNDEFAEVAIAFNDMAGQLSDWENSNVAKIRSEKLRIETIIEQMDDAIIGINEKQEILFINTKAKELFNLGRAKIIGKPVGHIAPNNPVFKSIIEKGVAGESLNIQINGKDAHFELETREITVPDVADDYLNELNVIKKQAGKVYILKNVTEFKERDEAKTNFIATISHELKTPISSIKMSVKLMNDKRVGNMNTEQHQLLANINEDSDRLLKLTTELLELARVETGNIQLNFVHADPSQIVDYAISSVSFQAAQKNVAIQVIKDGILPIVSADVEKTAWVLINLLSNALRYSNEGTTVTVTLTNKINEVGFAVKDTGKGIDEQYQQRLFDRYFQVPADGQNKAGTGLGLTISKDFIEAQNGKIGVKSKPGEGSIFYFSLPVG
jgi:NtrC-family two-component system sensor histidine kinase KinB